MNETLHKFTVEGAGTTVVHPLGLLMLICCGMATLFAPRKYAAIPLLVMICFVSSRQCIAIAEVNFYFARIMILFFGMTRGIITGELFRIRPGKLDLMVIGYGFVYILMGCILTGFSLSDLKMRCGYISELVGIFLFARMVLIELEDIKLFAIALGCVAITLSVFFIVENLTRRNLFSIFGGVSLVTIERDGRLRCQGAFGHPILAGVFWATFFPLLVAGYVGRWWSRTFFAISLLSAGTIVVLTASSTPILGLVVGVIGWGLFKYRRFSKHVALGFVILVLVLHFSMKAPVWSLIQRINITSGNSGYHRYILVDGFIRHFHEWWMFGTAKGTGHWGHFAFDTANQYVAAGVACGLIGLILFCGSLIVAMLNTGRIAELDPALGWGIALSILVLCVCYFGISIWGQMQFAYSIPLAMAGYNRFHEEELHEISPTSE